jgi:hypothetical protein
MTCKEESFVYRMEKADNDDEACGICARKIPRDVHRLSVELSCCCIPQFRMCGLCMLRLSRDLNMKAVNKWARSVAAQEI